MASEGEVVKGYVTATTTKGCFVRLAHHVTARVLLKVQTRHISNAQLTGLAFGPEVQRT